MIYHFTRGEYRIDSPYIPAALARRPYVEIEMIEREARPQKHIEVFFDVHTSQFRAIVRESESLDALC